MSRLFSDHDWAATPLGPVDAWPYSLHSAAQLVLSGGLPMILFWGPELAIAAYNEAYRTLLGDKHVALGQGFLEVWSEAHEIIAPEIEKVLQGESVYREGVHFVLHRRTGKAEDTWFDYQFSPVRDESCGVAGVLNIGVETTGRILAERSLAEAWATLRKGEGRPALLLALAEVLRTQAEPANAKKAVARLLGEHLGVDRAAWYEVDGDDYVVGAEFASDTHAMPDRYPDGRRGALFFDHRRADDSVRVDRDTARASTAAERKAFAAMQVGAYIAVPLIRNGVLVGGLAAHSASPREWRDDETALVAEVAERTWATVERVRAEAALRESEARYRGLFEAIDEGFCVLEFRFDVVDGRGDYRVLEANLAFYEQTGFPKEILGHWLRKAAPALEEHWYEIYGRVAQTRESIRFQQNSKMLGRWFDVYAFPIGDPQDLRLAVLFSDISERKRTEDHQNMLMAELDHRVKNILAVVQAITRQSLGRGKAAGPEATDLLVGRLNALAQSHALLASSRWEGARFADLVESAIAPYRGERAARIVVEGPELKVTPKAAQTLALALHELVTNAAKHGALSVERGSATAEWRLAGEGDALRLVFIWEEHGGPRILQAPSHKGFGSRLIEQTLSYELAGDVTLDFARDGLRAVMQLPLVGLRVGDGERPSDLRGNERRIAGDQAILHGKRVLVVEDEHVVAQETTERLLSAGCLVIGPVGTLLEALRIAASDELDAAVLDINLDGDFVWPAAHALRARGVPMIFISGYAETIKPPPELQDAVRLEKPVTRERLLATLAAATAGAEHD